MSEDNPRAQDNPSTDRAMSPNPGTVPQQLSRLGSTGPIAATGSVNC